MSQMDLLDLLAEVRPKAPDVVAEVVSRWLGPHGLNRVMRAQALGGSHIDTVRSDYLAIQKDRTVSDPGEPGGLLHGSATGIVVERWFGAEPFRVSWNHLFRTVRAHATPELAEALGAVCNGFAGGCTPEQWAAADAILPRRSDTDR